MDALHCARCAHLVRALPVAPRAPPCVRAAHAVHASRHRRASRAHAIPAADGRKAWRASGCALLSFACAATAVNVTVTVPTAVVATAMPAPVAGKAGGGVDARDRARPASSPSPRLRVAALCRRQRCHYCTRCCSRDCSPWTTSCGCLRPELLDEGTRQTRPSGLKSSALASVTVSIAFQLRDRYCVNSASSSCRKRAAALATRVTRSQSIAFSTTMARRCSMARRCPAVAIAIASTCRPRCLLPCADTKERHQCRCKLRAHRLGRYT